MPLVGVSAFYDSLQCFDTDGWVGSVGSHLACKNPAPVIPEVLFWNRAGVGVVAVVVVVG